MIFYSYFKTLVGKEVQSSSSELVSSVWQPGSVTLVLQVTVELKNDLAVQGTLHSVDQYLNIKLHNTRVVNEQKYPHMVRALQQHKFASYSNRPDHSMLQMSVRNCFIRGSVVRYVQVTA